MSENLAGGRVDEKEIFPHTEDAHLPSNVPELTSVSTHFHNACQTSFLGFAIFCLFESRKEKLSGELSTQHEAVFEVAEMKECLPAPNKNGIHLSPFPPVWILLSRDQK